MYISFFFTSWGVCSLPAMVLLNDTLISSMGLYGPTFWSPSILKRVKNKKNSNCPLFPGAPTRDSSFQLLMSDSRCLKKRSLLALIFPVCLCPTASISRWRYDTGYTSHWGTAFCQIDPVVFTAARSQSLISGISLFWFLNQSKPG